MHCGRGLRLGCSLAIVFCFMLHGLMAGSTGCCRVLLQHHVGRPGHATPLLPSPSQPGTDTCALLKRPLEPALFYLVFFLCILFYFSFFFFFALPFSILIFFVLYAWIKFSKSKRAFDQCANWTRCCCCFFLFLLAYLLTKWPTTRRRAASLLPDHNLY